MKVILHSDKDVLGMARAAEYALSQRETDWSQKVGVRVCGRYYGIRFNKTSLAVYPQSHDDCPTCLRNKNRRTRASAK